MTYNRFWSAVSFLSIGKGASVTPYKQIPTKKSNIKSPAMLPPGKDIITNKDINILSTKKDKSLPPKLAKSPPGFKSLIN